jgi:hypothetical protein
MKHMRPVNKKARRLTQDDNDVVALQNQAPARPHIPMGCSLSFRQDGKWIRPAALRDFASR